MKKLSKKQIDLSTPVGKLALINLHISNRSVAQSDSKEITQFRNELNTHIEELFDAVRRSRVRSLVRRVVDRRLFKRLTARKRSEARA